MATLKKKNGHLIKQNGHLSSCCCFICDCEATLKSSYTIDLGSGGWTDGTCDWCDQVLGAFVLGAIDSGSCCATYSDADVCDIDDCEPGGSLPDFLITLCLEDAGGGQLKWTARVEIRYFTIQNPSCNHGTATATYESDPFDPTDCSVVPVNLDKLTDVIEYGLCGGALPATITLDET